MKDWSEVSFTADAPPERRAAPTNGRAHGHEPRGLFARLRLHKPGFRAVVGLAALALIGGGVALYYGLREAPVFPLEKVVLEGSTRLTADEALGVAGLVRGQNLLDLDAPAAQRALTDALAFVREATVERALPSTLRIRLVERTPTLLVAMQHLYLADETGALYRRLQPGDKRNLPILTGLGRADLQRRPKEVTSAIAGALALVKALGDRCLEEILWHEVRGFGARLCKGPEVRFGLPPFESKLTHLERALHSTKRARVIHLDDERRPDRVVVRVGRQGA